MMRSTYRVQKKEHGRTIGNRGTYQTYQRDRVDGSYEHHKQYDQRAVWKGDLTRFQNDGQGTGTIVQT